MYIYMLHIQDWTPSVPCVCVCMCVLPGSLEAEPVEPVCWTPPPPPQGALTGLSLCFGRLVGSAVVAVAALQGLEVARGGADQRSDAQRGS